MQYVTSRGFAGRPTRSVAQTLSTVATVCVVAAGCANASVEPREEIRASIAACVPEHRLPPVNTTASLPPARVEYRNWVARTRDIPGGFGGFDRDSASGVWHVMLVDTVRLASAREMLVRWHAAGDLRALVTREELERADAKQAAWSLFELYEWLDFLTPRLLAPGGPIRGVGVNERGNTITVAPEGQSRAAAEALLGTVTVPCNLLVLEGR